MYNAHAKKRQTTTAAGGAALTIGVLSIPEYDGMPPNMMSY